MTGNSGPARETRDGDRLTVVGHGSERSVCLLQGLLVTGLGGLSETCRTVNSRRHRPRPPSLSARNRTRNTASSADA